MTGDETGNARARGGATMAERRGPRYGQVHWDVVERWLALPAGEDTDVWMVNLMKYRAVADYGSDGGPAVSGQEADDRYAPLGPLAAVGAEVAYLAQVVDQPAGSPRWDRVGIVRYPSRRAFFAMQERDDFKEKHVHKDAGMETTIVMGCRPAAAADPAPVSGAGERALIRVRRRTPGSDAPPEPTGLRALARFTVDGVVLGDDRAWDEVCFDLATPAGEAGVLDASGVEEQIVMAVDPRIDRLLGSVASAASTR